MADPIRAALERLVEAAERVARTDPIGAWWWLSDAIDAAHATLAAAPEATAEESSVPAPAVPALPPGYIAEHQGEDLELLQTFYAACLAEGGTADEIHLRGLRAVLAARPAPPAEGEVAELVAALRADAECIEVGHHDLCSNTADQLTRAADLLEQRQAAPVPVSERLPGPEDCDAEGRCWLHLPDMGTEPLWRLTDPSMRSRYHSHWLPATALPLPTTEPQP